MLVPNFMIIKQLGLSPALPLKSDGPTEYPMSNSMGGGGGIMLH